MSRPRGGRAPRARLAAVARAPAWRSAGALALPPRCAVGQGGDDTIIDARDAFRRHDRARLAALRAQAAAEQQPARDVGRLLGAHATASAKCSRPSSPPSLQRWSGTYVEDRLRNDWLLELVRRRDRAKFAAEYPALSNERRSRGHLLRARADQLSGKDVQRRRPRRLAGAEGRRRRLRLPGRDARRREAARARRGLEEVRASDRGERPRAARQAAAADRRRRRRASPRSSTARRATWPRRPARRRAPTPS